MKYTIFSIIKLKIFILSAFVLLLSNSGYSQNKSYTVLKKSNQDKNQKIYPNQKSISLTDIEHINSIFALNENEIWLTGAIVIEKQYKKFLLCSKNGGENWQAFSFDSDLFYLRIFFLNKNVAFLVGSQENKGLILKSTDGGISWRKLGVEAFDSLFDIQFINDRQGWIIGSSGTILRTNDGGENWKTSKIDGVKDLEAFGFKDELNGWATENKKVYRTLDGGITWSDVSKVFTDLLKKSKPEEIDFRKIKFFSKNEGVIGAEYKAKTDKIIEEGEPETYYHYGGIIFSTEDGGVTWKEREFTNLGLLAADFLDENNFWVIPSYGWQEEVILHSSDKGKNWTRISTGESIGNPFAIKFVDKNHGWLVADAGRLFRTVDAGKTWELQK